jgi:chorismate dehydratase
MARPVRLGAVSYLNARPLTWSLDGPSRAESRDGDRKWQIRYDLPSACAGVLARGEVDLALVSSVEYLRSGDYRMVPGVGIGSRGPVASIGLFMRQPLGEVRTIALDTSSLTAVALTRILCARRFGISPTFAPHGPDLAAMTAAHDAALLIGDPALEADHEALGLTKMDLGEEWTAMTGLPFVYAAWTGRSADTADVDALQAAQAEGVRSFEAIAAEYGAGDAGRTARAARYLRDNMKYGLGPDAVAGLQLFLDYAAELGLAPKRRLEFF